MLFVAVTALLAIAPAHMVGAINGNGDVVPLKVKTYEGQLMCTIRVTDGGDHGVVTAGGCKTLGDFAKTVRIEGTFAGQRYLDATGGQAATGKQHSDGYWVYTPDGKRYQLSR